MDRPRRHRNLAIRTALALSLLIHPPLLRGEEARPGRISATLPAVTRGESGQVTVEANRLEQSQDGTILEGEVTLLFKESRIQADRLSFREKRYVEAEGNVSIVWGKNRISGTRMQYDLQEDRGVVENAIGQVEPEFYFSAERVETLGKDHVNLEKATITTCTQPIPYWSFSVSSAEVHLGHYAQLWNLRLKTGRVPVFYLPYLVWPVKKDRAAGLLFPEFGTTQDRGRVFTEALFVPLGESADLTLLGEYYTIAGFGGGTELRYIPNERGSAILNGFYIQDKVAGFGRYRVTYRQTQEFLNGFRMVADINQVSDFGFFTDYERELRLASSSTILGKIEFTRNGEWTSVNIRDIRRDQLLSETTDLIQRALPEVEWRGRSKRMGRSPFYVSFNSSVASLQQYGGNDDISAEYYRADLFPTLAVPISPFPWIDINTSVSYRGTWYTQHKEPRSDRIVVVDEPLLRSAGGASLEIVGPKFSRIFQNPDDASSPKYKNTFEPRLQYTYRQGARNSAEVLVYDDIDAIISAQNLFSYGLRTRLLAKRPRAEQNPVPDSTGPILFPDGTRSEPHDETSPADMAEEAKSTAKPQEPVEILSFELSQSRSVDTTLNSIRRTPTGPVEPSPYSIATAGGRFRPGERLDLDARLGYDPLARKISEFDLAGSLHNDLARATFSLVRQNGRGYSEDRSHCTVNDVPGCFFGDPNPSSTQMRLLAGLNLFGAKLRLDTEGTYNFSPPAGQARNPDRRWRLEYYTQCCGFLAEYLSRDFSDDNTRKEFRFTVDLRGIGKLIDLHEGQDR